MIRTSVVMLLAVLISTDAVGQEKKAAVADPLAELPLLDSSLNYLLRVVKLRAVTSSGQQEKQMYSQFLAAEASFIGRHQEALALMDLGSSKRPPASNTDTLNAYEPKDAVEAVLAEAQKHQIVMVNEAHHAARHRAFATLLLEGLKKQGFTYFAAETFGSSESLGGEEMTTLAQRGYPTLKTGYYTNEPVFGNLVRTAMQLGFTPIAYEHVQKTRRTPAKDDEGRMQQINEREEGEAQNLKTRIFDKDPKAKVVVFAGYSHISKAPFQRMVNGKLAEQAWMAAKLKKLTGIDPLCVDQTEMMEKSKPDFEHPAYRLALDKGKVPGDRPVVLHDAKTRKYFVPPTAEDRLDMVVFHPRDRYEDGRPVWLRLGGLRKPLRIARLPQPANDESLLVQAFVKKEDVKTSVPIDQQEYCSADPKPVLLLPKGEYCIRVIDKGRKIVHETEAIVE
ncbi:MAG TPA: hypothetical protein PLN21_20025 [Gemmatales bacterium]|nr:hypothetical protein [Gemmatales bacterium]